MRAYDSAIRNCTEYGAYQAQWSDWVTDITHREAPKVRTICKEKLLLPYLHALRAHEDNGTSCLVRCPRPRALVTSHDDDIYFPYSKVSYASYLWCTLTLFGAFPASRQTQEQASSN